jgi:hypothetical protein
VTAISLFDWIAEALERGSTLTRLEARGILRLALQKLSLDPKELREEEALALLAAGLPEELAERSVPKAQELCRRVRDDLSALNAPRSPSGDALASVEPGAPPPTLFDWVSSAVEAETSLSRLEARGSLRLALKDAGLTPERATRHEIEVVLKAVAPKHLHACSVRDAEAVCGRILTALRTAIVLEASSGGESPEDVFSRFGRS